MTPTRTEIAAHHHARAVRFFWCFLIGATTVSLIGNIAHAVWHLIPFVVIQIGTAAVPPLFLLAVVHGIALSSAGPLTSTGRIRDTSHEGINKRGASQPTPSA